MTSTIRIFSVVIALFGLKVTLSQSAEPTVIFLGPNGARPVDQSNGYPQSSPLLTSSISNRDSSDSGSSSSGSRFDLYAISAAIKEKLGEKLQDRTNKKGPRIIVIPQNAPVQRSTYSPSSSGYNYNPYAYSPSSGYGNSYSNSYGNSYAAASQLYPSYQSYQSYPSYSGQMTSSYPQSQPSAPSSGSSYGSPYAAASTPYATYAYPSTSSMSNYFGSSLPFSSLMSRVNPFMLYPQLAALSQSLYGSY